MGGPSERVVDYFFLVIVLLVLTLSRRNFPHRQNICSAFRVWRLHPPHCTRLTCRTGFLTGRELAEPFRALIVILVIEVLEKQRRDMAYQVASTGVVANVTFPSPLKEICPDCPGWPKANEYIIRGSPREKKSRDEPRFLYSNVPRE